jgi:hypothetical protein
MKLTKSKLKQLIKEELSNVLREQEPPPQEPPVWGPADPPNINEIWRVVQELQRRVDKIDPQPGKPIPLKPGSTGASPGWPRPGKETAPQKHTEPDLA